MVGLVPSFLHDTYQRKIQLNELGTTCDSVEPFTRLILQSGQATVRLLCTVPTWSPSSTLFLDLHDLNELRSRSLLFIHDLLQSLRSSGVAASYCLTPSDSPLCLVCASTPGIESSYITSTAHDLIKDAQFREKEHVLLADLDSGPCLVIT